MKKYTVDWRLNQVKGKKYRPQSRHMEEGPKREIKKEEISSPKASNGQRFPCPALLSPWFSWGEAGQRPR